MKKITPRFSQEELKKLYGKQRTALRRRLNEFGIVSPNEHFYELIYCLLTPQSSAVHADKVIGILKESNFQNKEIDPEPVLRRKDCYIRFHRTKAKHLITVKEQFPIVASRLSAGLPSEELRFWLLKNVKGLGWKESSHFLRNIGYRNLAILDRHILRNLIRFGVIRSLPKSLTAKHYLQIEEKFRKFSKQTHIPMDELDLLFWSMETGEILK